MIEVKLLQLLKQRDKPGERSLYWLSKASGVTYNTLHAFANGKRDSVFFPTLDAICQALGCQVGDVLAYAPDKKGRGR